MIESRGVWRVGGGVGCVYRKLGVQRVRGMESEGCGVSLVEKSDSRV